MHQYSAPKHFYSYYDPLRIMSHPIQFYVRGTVSEYGHRTDHVEFFTIDITEKENCLAYINRLLLNQREDGSVVINGKAIFNAKLGNQFKELQHLETEIKSWFLAGITELDELNKVLDDYLKIFKNHSNHSRASFWKMPLEPLIAVQNTLIEAIHALATMKKYEELTEDLSFEQYSRDRVKAVNLILDCLKNKIADLANNPVLQSGDIGKTLKQFTETFKIDLPKIGLCSRLSSAVENIHLTMSCNK